MSYCQNTEKILDIYKKSLKTCDSLNIKLEKDLKVCNNSDSTKSALIVSYSKNADNYNMLLDNQKKQIENYKNIINTQTKLKCKSKPLLFGSMGIVIGYLIRTELQLLLNKY